MRSLRYWLLPAFILFSFLNVSSQDKIYLKKTTQSGKIARITPSEIIFSPAESQQKQMSVNLKDAILLFNERGDFLIPSTLEFGKDETQQMINRFMSKDGAQYLHDRIYTTAKVKTEGTINNIDKKYAYILTGKNTEKIDLKSVGAIIYKTGDHKLYRDNSKVSEILTGFRFDVSAQAAKDIAAKAAQAEKERLAAQQKNTGESASVKTVNYADLLGSVTPEEFEAKAIQKTKQLNGYLKYISNQNNIAEEVNKAIDQAVALFIGEAAKVEVSSLTRGSVKTYRIREYLSHIKLNKYDKIEIEWTKVQYVNDLKKGTDGNYYGSVTFEQVFRGYKDGKIVYTDVTVKKGIVILKAMEKNIDGKIKNVWDVLLSDIGVESTDEG